MSCSSVDHHNSRRVCALVYEFVCFVGIFAVLGARLRKSQPSTFWKGFFSYTNSRQIHSLFDSGSHLFVVSWGSQPSDSCFFNLTSWLNVLLCWTMKLSGLLSIGEGSCLRECRIRRPHQQRGDDMRVRTGWAAPRGARQLHPRVQRLLCSLEDAHKVRASPVVPLGDVHACWDTCWPSRGWRYAAIPRAFRACGLDSVESNPARLDSNETWNQNSMVSRSDMHGSDQVNCKVPRGPCLLLLFQHATGAICS